MLLDEIVKHKRHEVKLLHARLDLEKARRAIKKEASSFDFKAIFHPHQIALVAEVKKASPSAGVIISEYDPVDLAKEYEEAGAAAISVLTDQKYFQGSLEDLDLVEKEIELPVLRKDFVIDEAQIYESRLAGADAILLIARILSEKELKSFIALAHDLGLSCLVEAHDEKELEKTLAAGAEIIGVNNRDLDSLEIDINTTLRLIDIYPEIKQKHLVSESGIHSHEQVKLLKEKGVQAILVGEGILRSGNVSQKIKELMAE